MTPGARRILTPALGGALLLALAVACDPPFEPPSGEIRVSVATVGSDLDADGYRLSLDGGAARTVAPNGVVTFTGLYVGDHAVALSDVAVNCGVSGSLSRTVRVQVGASAAVSYNINCLPLVGSVQVTTSTSGADVDPDGYLVAVDGGPPQTIPGNGLLTVSNLSIGPHTVMLSGLAANCAVSGPNPRSVTVTFGGSSLAPFSIGCAAITGSLLVTTTTTGFDLDPDGYLVHVDSGGGADRVVAVNATTVLTGIPVGDRAITLLGVAPNCTVSPANGHVVTVIVGDTVAADFAVTCAATTGVVRAITSTSGAQLDANGYTVLMDYYCDYYYGCHYGWTEAAGVNDTVVIGGVPAGDHPVWLDGIASNCTLAGPNPRTATVPLGDTVTLVFEVTCVPAGAVQVTATASGTDVDNYFTVQVDNGPGYGLPAGGVVTITEVPEGDRAVSLGDVSGNCAVQGGNQQTVHVVAGDTVSASFQVDCVGTLGTLVVTVVTTGTDIDADGYAVLVDEVCDYYYGCYYVWNEPAAANDTVTIANIPFGNHAVYLGGVAPNCAVSGPSPQVVTVPASDTGRVVFAVTCVATGSVRVTTTATGVDLDSYFTAQVDGGSLYAAPLGGVTTIDWIPEGDHTITLGDVAGNCTVPNNPQVVHVSVHDTVEAAFDVTCVSMYGVLQVSVATSGVNLDPDGYTVGVDYVCDYYYGCYYLWSESAAANDTVTIASIPFGSHTVYLDGVAPNCAVTGPNPETASVPSGDTVRVAFAVACVQAAALRVGTAFDPNKVVRTAAVRPARRR